MAVLVLCTHHLLLLQKYNTIKIDLMKRKTLSKQTERNRLKIESIDGRS
jgi:hypothetical protein